MIKWPSKQTHQTSVDTSPCLYIDVTTTNRFDYRSGIQRVVKNLTRELLSRKGLSFQVVPVYLKDNWIHYAARFSEKLLGLEKGFLGEEQTIQLKKHSSILMPDMVWDFYSSYLPVLNQIQAHGGKVITLIHDLLPYKYPQFFTGNITKVFPEWLSQVTRNSDQIVCTSQHVKNDLLAYGVIENIGKDMQISIVPPGADIIETTDESDIRNDFLTMFSTDQPIFSMISTIEPRKGHRTVLDAFENLWKEGWPFLLLFAGKIGWVKDDLISRIQKHPEKNKRFFFIENPSDCEVNLIYQHSKAIIVASYDEGFGLPIVEAALHQVPTIARDIPVFREVAGEGAFYFQDKGNSSLGNQVIEMAKLSDLESKRLSSNVNIVSWGEYVDRLITTLYKSSLLRG